MIAASGDAILMVDADGASEITEFEKLTKKVGFSFFLKEK